MYNLVNRTLSGLKRGRAVPIVEQVAYSDLVRIVVAQSAGAAPAAGRRLLRNRTIERYLR